MTEKIIALVDASPYAASVCDHAAWIAGRTGAPVELLHVLGRREGGGEADLSGAIQLGARSALLEQLAELDRQRARLMAERGHAILDGARARAEAAGATATARLLHGDLIETVAGLEAEARVIVIGKRGEAVDFARGHLGSNLERIVRVSQRPVLVAARAFRPVRRVLVAWDGGASASRAVEVIAASPVFRGLEICLATVGADTPAARASLAEAAARLTAAGLSASTLLRPGAPDAVLGALVEGAEGSDGFDLLVMGAFGHSRIRSLIIGSTTTAMVRACKVPVLLIR